MRLFEITSSNAETAVNLYWVRGWARAHQKYFVRLAEAQLGERADARRATRAESGLERAKARLSQGVRRKS